MVVLSSAESLRFSQSLNLKVVGDTQAWVPRWVPSENGLGILKLMSEVKVFL